MPFPSKNIYGNKHRSLCVLARLHACSIKLKSKRLNKRRLFIRVVETCGRIERLVKASWSLTPEATGSLYCVCVPAEVFCETSGSATLSIVRAFLS